MLKYFALLINSIALLVYHFFFAEGITITPKAPESVKPDTEFTVEVTINKGSTSGFAKLQQDLPEGFTAVQEDNNGASFTFSNQSVKFIWMSLPSDKEFKVKYKVKVAATVSGDQTISGKFSYVTDNEKQNAEVPALKINVSGGSQPVVSNTTPVSTSTTTPSNTNTNTNTTPTNNSTNTDNATTSNTTSGNNQSGNTVDNSLTSQLIDKSSEATSNPEPSSIVVKRNMPAVASGSFTVEITVNKGNTTGFAKLTENLPEGFSATLVEAQGASFTFADGKVKYVWVSMPAQPEFKISYKVTVAPSASGVKVIDGVFSYIENDDTKKYVIPANSINIGGTTSEPVVANNTTNTSNTNTTTNNAATANTTTNNTTTNNATTANTNNTTTTNATANNDKTMSATNIPSPQASVNYKVQIAALQNAVSADRLAARLNVNQKISTEMADGYTKYTVGSHSEYKQARDAREQIKSKGVNDAFVTAYNGGKRITVQEALMITSQKWYR